MNHSGGAPRTYLTSMFDLLSHNRIIHDVLSISSLDIHFSRPPSDCTPTTPHHLIPPTRSIYPVYNRICSFSFSFSFSFLFSFFVFIFFLFLFFFQEKKKVRARDTKPEGNIQRNRADVCYKNIRISFFTKKRKGKKRRKDKQS